MKIPYGKQSISKQDIKAVVNVLKSEFLTQGPKVPEFEDRVSKTINVKHTIAVNSATSALHIACLSLELGKGDLIWTSPNSFVASANCGVYCNAEVDFVDIDPSTFNISTSELEKKLVLADKKNRLPKILIVVHFGGCPCDMKTIYNLSQKYNFSIIEDASHAAGALYLNEYIGTCKYSDITVMSFHPVKIVTSAEGGVALTNKTNLAKKMQLYRSHGITRDPNYMTNPREDKLYYEQVNLGYNYRMTDLQAALGISQWDRLEEFVTKRNLLSQEYNNNLIHLPLIPQFIPEDRRSARHLYVVRIDETKSNIDQKKIISQLHKKGIFVGIHYIPIHTQPFYKNLGFSWGDFPVAEKYYRETISLPLFPDLTPKQMMHILNTLNEIFNDK